MRNTTKTIRLYQEGEVQENYTNNAYEIEAFSVLGTTEHQEDRLGCVVRERSAVLAICDGIGGLDAGAVAAQTAIDTVKELAACMDWEREPQEFLRLAIEQADENICALKDEEGNTIHCGCTIVLLVIVESKMYWANVGDSRIYFLRKKEMVQITVDHNYGERLLRQLSYQEISRELYERELPKAAALTSYLGIGNVREKYICEEGFPLERDDVIILQSDGLYKLLGEEEMLQIMQKHLRDLKWGGENLLTRAEENCTGYQDNTTFILARMK